MNQQKKPNIVPWFFLWAIILLIVILAIPVPPNLRSSLLIGWGTQLVLGLIRIKELQTWYERFLIERQWHQDSEEYWEGLEKHLQAYKHGENMTEKQLNLFKKRIVESVGDQTAIKIFHSNHALFPSKSPYWCMVKSTYDAQFYKKKGYIPRKPK